MSHGEKMSLYGSIIALQEVMIHIQKEDKLREKIQEVEDGGSEASSNRSR